MQKNKLLLLFPDGVGIRNYLYSRVFEDATNELILLHNFTPETIAYIKTLKNIAADIAIPGYKESAKERLLRELISLCRLRHNSQKVQNSTIVTNWNTNHKGISKRLFYKAIEFLAPFYKSYESILKLESAYEKAIRKNRFYHTIKALLQEIQPSHIFCSHQRALKMPVIFAAATDLGIPNATVIYSWDNLPKARLALRADQYFVWSDFMKKEMRTFYPEIPSERIIITGTPQFECYQQQECIIDKDQFYKEYGLDVHKKTICFSGDDVTTSPDDPKYLADLAQAIIGSGLQDAYQILLRRCPVDVSGRYQETIEKYDGLIKEATPLWKFNKSSSWTDVYPLYEDVALLVSTAFYCDIVVNVGSTMAFDFAMFGKPCVFINYDQELKRNENWSVNTIYKFQHFRSMPENAVIWFNSKEEIMQTIVKGIENGIHPDMIAWRDLIIADYQNASQKIQAQWRQPKSEPDYKN